MNNRHYYPIIYTLILIAGVYLGKYWINPKAKDQGKIDSIIRLIEENYVDGFNVEQHDESIVKSIMKELDPHSNYFTKKEQTYLEGDMQGSFSGIGIEFNIIADSLVVVSSISGGPSDKLGIFSGDRIVEVNGENIASVGLTNQDVFEKLRGKKGSEVNIRIYRKGNKNLLYYTIE